MDAGSWRPTFVYYPVQLLCQVLQVVPSRYYAWYQRAVTKAEPAWQTAMLDVFEDYQRRYGTRRLQVELRELGHRVGLTAQGFYGPRDRFNSRQALRPNLLLDQPKSAQANRVWVSDITCLPLAG